MSSKRSRILALQRCSSNQSALARELCLLRKDPDLLDVVTSRSVLDRSLDSLWAQLGQTHILQVDDGDGDVNDFTWYTLSLRRVLEFLVADSDEFRARMCQLYRREPCTPNSPWDLIFNFDEATPGAVLNLNNRRKMWTIMVTLKQFGPQVLQHEAAWLPIACLRSNKAKDVQGGFSGASRHLMRDWFVQQPRLQEEGLLLPIGPNGRSVLVFIKFGNTLSDEDALKKFWSGKGASGIQPCWKCWVSRLGPDGTSLREFDATATMLDIRCGNSANFQMIDDKCRYVQANVLARSHGTVTQKQFHELQQAYGLTYNPHGILWDSSLRGIVLPQSCSRYDAAHCFFCNGMVNEELDHLLERLEQICKVGFAELQVYCGAAWRSATCFNGRKTKLSKIDAFTNMRANYWKSTGKFRPNASELLTLVPLIAHFLQTVPGIAAQIPAETFSFVMLAKVEVYQLLVPASFVYFATNV
jgi:hypothetical protein